MKKISLVFVCIISMILIFPLETSAQWYSRYGVDNAAQLTEDQVNLAVTRADKNIRAGKTCAWIVGAGTVLGGINLYRGYNYNGDEFLGGLGLAVGGMTLIGVGVVVGLAGLMTYSNNNKRMQEIIKAHGPRKKVSINPYFSKDFNVSSVGLNLCLRF